MEMIAMIAIILFLTALLMPALRRVVETAKLAKCMSNIRQIGQATMLYAGDNEGLAPFGPANYWKTGYFVPRSHDPSHATYDPDYPKNKWFPEYLSKPTWKISGRGKKATPEPVMSPVAYCPLGGRYGSQGPVVYDSKGRFYNNVSYGINPSLIQTKWFFGDDTNPGGSDDRYCVPLQQVQHPGQVCLWIEGVRSKLGWPQRNGVSGRHYAKYEVANRDDPVDNGFPVWEERGFATVFFVDGHVLALKMREEVPASDDRFWEHTSKVSRRFK